jgi:hypothetical protein
MNKDDAKDFLPLVQALADGKTIQFCPSPLDEWRNIERMDTKTWSPSHFRVKPEPREWDMWITPKGVLTTNSDMLMRESIRVREILD